MSPLLAETERRFSHQVAAAQADGRAPSLIAAVVRDGEVAARAFAGQDPAPTADTQYRIGSITKTMTAALVLRLRDEGRLSLDDLLYRHLAGTPIGAVTLRQLLGHAAGLQREPEGAWWERNPGTDLDSLLAALTPDKLAFAPHQTHHYSNLAYGLLGAVLHRVTGLPWSKLVGTRLLEPLGMSRTTYDPTAPFAPGYVVHPWHGTLREEPRPDTGAMAPAGQLWSTIDDLSRWAAFLADPDPAILAPGTVEEMCAPVVMSDLSSWTAGHGLGLQLWRRGERVYIGHTGSMPGYLAVLLVHRPSRTGVVAFANTYTLRGSGIAALGMDLLTAVLDTEPAAVTPWRPGSVPPADAAELCGRWWWMGIEHEARWDAPAGELVMSIVGGTATPWRFTPDGVDRWRCRSGSNDGEILTVLRDRTGGLQGLDIATFVYTRDPDIGD